MKLIMAVLSGDDGKAVIDHLIKKGFSVTRMATTGGFLRTKNTTILSGVRNERLEEALAVIRDNCKTKKYAVAANTDLIAGATQVATGMPSEVQLGGASVFVLDIERFEKY